MTNAITKNKHLRNIHMNMKLQGSIAIFYGFHPSFDYSLPTFIIFVFVWSFTSSISSLSPPCCFLLLASCFPCPYHLSRLSSSHSLPLSKTNVPASLSLYHLHNPLPCWLAHHQWHPLQPAAAREITQTKRSSESFHLLIFPCDELVYQRSSHHSLQQPKLQNSTLPPQAAEQSQHRKARLQAQQGWDESDACSHAQECLCWVSWINRRFPDHHQSICQHS